MKTVRIFLDVCKRTAAVLSVLVVANSIGWSSTIEISHVIGKHGDYNGTTLVTLDPDPVQLIVDPSSAFMEARKLKTPGAMIEIQAIAVVKE